MSRVAAQPQVVRILRPRLACRRGPDLRGRSGVWRIHGSHQRRQTRQPTWPGCTSSSILDPLARVVAVSSADDAAPTPRAVRSCYISHVRGSLRHPAQSRCCVADDTCAPARSFGVFEATTLTALVTLIRLALESTPSRECASIGAITRATIASGTEIRLYAAASAEKSADCLSHRRTTLNRRTTGYAALMLHSGGSPTLSTANPRCGNRGFPHLLVSPVLVSIPWCSATARIRERFSPPRRGVLDVACAPRAGQRPRFEGHTVLMIDETGTLGAAQARELFERARDADARVMLLGDTSQHESVGRGSVLRGLADEHGSLDLVKTRRANEEWLRELATDLRAGVVSRALDVLREKGRCASIGPMTKRAWRWCDRGRRRRGPARARCWWRRAMMQ